TTNSFVYDDTQVDYSQQTSGIELPPGGEGPPYTNEFTYAFIHDPFVWIDIFAVTNDEALLGLHNVRPGCYAQLLTNFNLSKPYPTNWGFSQIVLNTNPSSTNVVHFAPEPTCGRPMEFYRGVQGFPKVSVHNIGDAIEPTNANSGQPGGFQITLSDALPTNF